MAKRNCFGSWVALSKNNKVVERAESITELLDKLPPNKVKLVNIMKVPKGNCINVL